MKRISFILVLFLLCSGMMVMNSCNKEEEVQSESLVNQNGVTVDNGILCFETMESYETTIKTLSIMDYNLLNQWEDQMRYNSLRNDNKQKTITDEVGLIFSTLLNPNKEIIIAGNYFQFDFDSRKVLEKQIDPSKCDLKSEVISEITISFDDNYELTENGQILKSVKPSPCANDETGWKTMNLLVNGHARYRIKITYKVCF